MPSLIYRKLNNLPHCWSGSVPLRLLDAESLPFGLENIPFDLLDTEQVTSGLGLVPVSSTGNQMSSLKFGLESVLFHRLETKQVSHLWSRMNPIQFIGNQTSSFTSGLEDVPFHVPNKFPQIWPRTLPISCSGNQISSLKSGLFLDFLDFLEVPSPASLELLCCFYSTPNEFPSPLKTFRFIHW